MSPSALVLRSLRFHWRSNLWVLLGSLLAAAILVGALAVGDSVRYSLREMALARLGARDGAGGVHLALTGGSRFFRAELAPTLAADLNVPAAAVILLPATAAAGEGEARAGRVQVVGVDPAFWRLGGAESPLTADSDEAAVLNRPLADRLGVRPGDEVLLRVDRPSLLSRDAPLSTIEDASFALRLRVAAVVGEDRFGRFDLSANQVPALNAFVPLSLLQRETDLAGRVNTLLLGAGPEGPATPARAAAALRDRWDLADAALELRRLPGGRGLELRTDRVFLDPPIAEAALKAHPGARGVLTWFVNGLSAGGKSTPYSTVTALDGPPGPARPLGPDEAAVNSWLAEDLGVGPGSELTLSYYVVGPRRGLEERSARFRIREVLPVPGPAADPDLMPPFPGVAEAENCRDWKPGIPIDLARIRVRDEQYWDTYRGAPKAYLSLAAGQRLWENRFGNLTAVRYPPTGDPETVALCIRQSLNPAMLGLFFHPVRAQAEAAGNSLDFGQLFLGFSFFLIVSALLLTALLFALGVEQRSEEVGVLLALGIPPARVRGLLLAEGAVLAGAAALLGPWLGILYTRGVIQGLSSVWSGAVAGADLRFHAEPGTLAAGAAAGFAASLLAIYLVGRLQARRPARELLQLSGETLTDDGTAPHRRRPGLPTALGAGGAALALLLAAILGGSSHAAGSFFGAGALLLVAGIALARWWLTGLDRPEATGLRLAGLGARNSARRPARSLAAVALLAAGSFLVVAVGANRHDPAAHAGERTSGTGGFALYAESTLPVHVDLNTAEGRDAYGLDPEALAGVTIHPLRLREGDQASCLNLNRAQTPRVLGADPAKLAGLGAFTFSRVRDGRGWEVLDRELPDGAVPAVGDENTVVWSLGRDLGQVVEIADDRGEPLRLRIVGLLRNTILQGGLLISEEQFVRRFPSRSGYQVFLVDAPPDRAAEAGAELARGLEDSGLDVVPAAHRLAQFAAVENTYLTIFAVLGGLGLALGTLGLGVVVLRNVLERRSEMALLRAVGFSRPALRWLVFSEHGVLLAAGLLIGLASAVVAVAPVFAVPGAEVPWLSLGATLFMVAAGGVLWTFLASAMAVQGPVLDALRSE